MPQFTQKYKIADYDRLHAHADLLELYLYDTQTGQQPDAVEESCEHGVRVQLWRATSASGGYVVVHEAMPNIWLLDDAIFQFSKRATQYNLGIRICLERLQIVRARMSKTA